MSHDCSTKPTALQPQRRRRPPRARERTRTRCESRTKHPEQLAYKGRGRDEHTHRHALSIMRLAWGGAKRGGVMDTFKSALKRPAAQQDNGKYASANCFYCSLSPQPVKPRQQKFNCRCNPRIPLRIVTCRNTCRRLDLFLLGKNPNDLAGNPRRRRAHSLSGGSFFFFAPRDLPDAGPAGNLGSAPPRRARGPAAPGQPMQHTHLPPCIDYLGQ